MNSSIVAEKFQVILKFVGYTLATSFIGSMLTVAIALQAAKPNYVFIWLWFTLNSLNLVARYFAFVRVKLMSAEDRLPLIGRAWRHTFITGSIWGLSSILFIPTVPIIHQAALAIIVLGPSMTSIPLMSDIRGISSFFLPSWLPTAFAFYLCDRSLVVPIAILFMLGCVYVVAFIVRNTLDEFIILRLERDKALRELREASGLQLSFFLAASHDFRQPLQAMSMYTMAIKQMTAIRAPEIRTVIGKLEDTFESLEHLIDETITYAKVSTGLQPPAVESIPAVRLADQLHAKFGERASAKGLRFTVRCDESCVISTDANILDRILGNLITNALRHTRTGGILVAFRKRGQRCSVQVWDTGIGIPKHQQDRIFDAFFQLSCDTGERHAGYGLGLMIVQRLCERIGAELIMSSRINKGTVFRFFVDLATTQVLERKLPEVLVEFAGRLDGHSIAVVDDDDSVRESLTTILSGVGARVIAATDHASLLDALRNVESLSLLLTDFHLSSSLGSDIVDDLRLRFPEARSIILTGDASDDTQIDLRRRGYTVMLKPVSPDTLLSKISADIEDASSINQAMLRD